MANSDAQHGKDDTEITYLVERSEPFWTQMDKFLAVFGVLMTLGQGVEINLPGVINQQISCDLELSSWQEGILDCILYLTLAVALVISGPLSDWFGRRELILFSLYISIPSTVVCAIVAQYYTLILSRALIGICLGLNISTGYVMITEVASNKAVLQKIVVIAATMFPIGGVWAAGLGYLLLDLLGWRIFILVTSLPLFVPPIFMLHFCFKGTAGKQLQDEQNQITPKGTLTVPNFVARVIKLGLFDALNLFQGWLLILLVPALIQSLKTKEAEPNSDCSVTVTQGADFLLLGTVTSASLLGKVFMHFIRERIRFRKLQVIVASLTVLAFTGMIAKENLAVVFVTNFIVKFLNGIDSMAFEFIICDIEYLGTERFAVGSGVVNAISMAGGWLGTVMIAFIPISYVLVTSIVLSALKILLVLSMTEVQ